MSHLYAPPPNARRAGEVLEEMAAQQQTKLERAQARAVSIPEGEISTEMLGQICRENTGFAINTLLEIIEDPEKPAAVRKAAADTIIERGHGKMQNDVPNAGGVTIVIQRFASDSQETITIDS